eukprot:4812959-Alexandrium_andersonii.AAC.1
MQDHALLDLGGDSLRVVAVYKHMGTVSGAGFSLASEVQARCAAMYDKFAPIRRSVYDSDRIDTQAKLVSVEALLYSRLFYNVGTWGDFSSKEPTMRAAYMKPLRVVARMCPEKGAKETNAQ